MEYIYFIGAFNKRNTQEFPSHINLRNFSNKIFGEHHDKLCH